MRSRYSKLSFTKKQKKRKRIPVPVTVLFVLVLLGGVSYAAAWTWQSVQEGSPPVQPIFEQPAIPDEGQDSQEDLSVQEERQAQVPDGESAENRPESGPDEQEEPVEGGVAREDQEEENESEIFPVRQAYSYALPQSQRVDNSYFDDAIFFGDSISVGIPLYNVMPNADVVAVQGINTLNILTKEAVPTDEGDVTMLEAAAAYGEKGKVYVMLGSNGIGYDKETFIGGYRDFVKELKSRYPETTIYLQSMLPVTAHAREKYPDIDNETIDEYNLAIMALAQEQRVYYLDVAAALADENGQLPMEISPNDGVHLNAVGYARWFEYLRTHTTGR